MIPSGMGNKGKTGFGMPPQGFVICSNLIQRYHLV
jgi:hypothetical protein